MDEYLAQSIKNVTMIDENFITFFDYDKKYWVLRPNELGDLDVEDVKNILKKFYTHVKKIKILQICTNIFSSTIYLLIARLFN